MPLISELETRITALSTRFLDPQIANEADASFIPDLDSIAAFRLLAHAEIEDWMERYASEELTQLKSNVATISLRQAYRVTNLAILFAVPVSFELPFDETKIRGQLNETLARASQFLKDNNGIKAMSFCKLAMICGACVDEVDVSLVQALNSFGTARGMVAHKSSQRVTTLRAPSAEKTEATGLVQLLKMFFNGMNPAPKTALI